LYLPRDTTAHCYMVMVMVMIMMIIIIIMYKHINSCECCKLAYWTKYYQTRLIEKQLEYFEHVQLCDVTRWHFKNIQL
jgi:hypothetical protein